MPIDLSLTPENELVQQTVRDFAQTEIAPHIREWDERHEAHREVFARMGALGFLGAPIWTGWGGAGMDYVSFGILCEELERVDSAFRVVLSVHTALNSLTLQQWATEEQKQRWLVPQARGEKLATFALTEPGVGTDAANLATTARRDGDSVRPQRLEALDQPRRPGRPLPRLRVASTAPRSTRASRRSCSSAAWPASAPERSTASWAFVPATPVSVVMQDVRVPLANRIGEEGEGFTIAMSAIDQGRFTVASGAVGLAQACLDASA